MNIVAKLDIIFSNILKKKPFSHKCCHNPLYA